MQDLKIHFLNTIWSDAIILEKENYFAMVDTASSFYYPMIEEYLNQNQIKTLDFIILTHFHSDHYGNVQKIIENYEVKKIYLKHYYGLEGSTGAGYESNDEYIEHELKMYNEIILAAKTKNTNLIFIDDKPEQTITWQEISIELYDTNNRLYDIYHNPNNEFYKQRKFSENFNSIGIFINYQHHPIFLGADVTCSTTNIEELQDLSIKMINKIYQKHRINKIELYKSCHHGGSGTNTKKLCELLQPDYTIITNTNRWLDNYDTIQNIQSTNEKAIILKTDYYQYIFTINTEITYKQIAQESLFITLNKN